MIKVRNNRTGGSLYHYAHFFCDCLFPEVLGGVYKYDTVIREKSIHQSLGNFSSIYEELMNSKNKELLPEEYQKVNIQTYHYKNKEEYLNKESFEKFRQYVFQRYKISPHEYNKKYPEILLVKRGGRIKLIDDEYLKTQNTNTSTGKERREINNIEEVEDYLRDLYGNRFKALYFETLSFSEQIKYFNNAKLIVCAHGAVMSNMFFCKPNTIVIEVTCNAEYPFFDDISRILNLKHLKCHQNNFESVKKIIDMNYIN